MAGSPTDTDESVDDALASILSPEDTRYALICRECRTVWPYQRDSKTVKAARNGEVECSDCGTALDLAVDSKEGESDGG